MREINALEITETVARLCVEAGYYLPDDVKDALKKGLETEESPQGREVFEKLIENYHIAEKEGIPLCQDCGFAVITAEVGQDVHVTGGDFNEAIQAGVRKGYADGFLRKSIVEEPAHDRRNTKDNTPAIIHTDIVPGDKIKIIVFPKGGGSENMSALGMLKPSQGEKGVKEFVLNAVEKASSNPCPPIIVGVGLGGTSETALWLAKKALMRPLGSVSPEPKMACLEKELLEIVNSTGIGPQGFGGRITALGVHVEQHPSHIASMPVAVNIQCHAARRKEAVL